MCLDGLQPQFATIAAVQKEAGKSRAAALVLHGEPGVENARAIEWPAEGPRPVGAVTRRTRDITDSKQR